MSNVSIAGYAGWPAYDTFLIVSLSDWPIYDLNPLRPNSNPKKFVLGSYRVHELGWTLTPLGPSTGCWGPYFHSSLLLLRSINVHMLHAIYPLRIRQAVPKYMEICAHAACHLSFKDQVGGPKVYGDMCTPHFIFSFMPCG